MNNKLIVLLCLCPGIAMAQADSLRKKVTYYNTFVSGVMIGSAEDADEKEFSVTFLTTHGVRLNPWIKAGVGVGLDTYYDLKAFPLVLSITFDQDLKKQGLFVQFNGGYSFARYAGEPEFEEIEVEAKGGMTFNPMVGYRVRVENVRIYFQAGYKYQTAQIKYDYPDGWGLSQALKDYDLNRFVVQLGFGFE